MREDAPTTEERPEEKPFWIFNLAKVKLALPAAENPGVDGSIPPLTTNISAWLLGWAQRVPYPCIRADSTGM